MAIQLESKSERTSPLRIVIIGDREFLNPLSLIEYGNSPPNSLRPVALFVPGGELNREIFELAREAAKPYQMHVEPKTTGQADLDFYKIVDEKPFGDASTYAISEHLFSFIHLPYDTKEFQEYPIMRTYYCALMAGMAAATEPDLIFLSNFKLILDPFFINVFPGIVINVHPSKLPILKGFKPELRALNGEFPEAAGYTIHFVDKDLDGGATIFQQQVLIDSYSKELAKEMGDKEYERRREETLRLKIIQAQSMYSPRVLELVGSNKRRLILKDRDAFIREDRPGFEFTDVYQASLEEDFKFWLKSEHTKDGISFETWKSAFRKPYQRVLFEMDGEMKTAEEILGAPSISIVKTPHPIRRYSFTLDGVQKDDAAYARIVDQAMEFGRSNGGEVFRSRMERDASGAIRCQVLASTDLVRFLGDIPFEAIEMSTRVSAKRIPFDQIDF